MWGDTIGAAIIMLLFFNIIFTLGVAKRVDWLKAVFLPFMASLPELIKEVKDDRNLFR